MGTASLPYGLLSASLSGSLRLVQSCSAWDVNTAGSCILFFKKPQNQNKTQANHKKRNNQKKPHSSTRQLKGSKGSLFPCCTHQISAMPWFCDLPDSQNTTEMLKITALCFFSKAVMPFERF